MLDLSNPLIINAELFFQCHGNCSGCFLTSEERLEENTYLNKIRNPILSLLKTNKQNSAIILGFGRGNLLNLTYESLNDLLLFIENCESYINNNIIYEISSSLIGKIDIQIEKAKYLISKNKNIYFNIVINSEITSSNFWNNWELFYTEISNVRKSWGLLDNFGDILVLNINPKMLPDLKFIEKHIKNKGSPFNISLFPFSDSIINNEDLLILNNWAKELWNKFNKKDLNIKNYLNLLKNINIDNNINDIKSYHEKNINSYYFIDKSGKIIDGSLSIMGEVDYIRLKQKYNINPNLENTIRKMQKTTPCNICEYQKECLLSGAYLTMLQNSTKIKNAKYCLNGYQEIFKLSNSAIFS